MSPRAAAQSLTSFWTPSLTNLIAVIAIVVTLTVASCGGFASKDAVAMGNRITITETKQDNTDKRLERIERQLERMDEKLDKALEKKR